MSERMFDPSNAQYKKVEDLPKEEQGKFADIEDGGFVRKEAAEELRDAEKITEMANRYKEAGITARDIHGNIKVRRLKETKKVLADGEITTTNVLRNRALEEEFKPVDVLQTEANKIHKDKYPEQIYLEKLKNDPNDLKGIPKRIWGNKNFAMEAVKLNRKALDKIGYGKYSLGGNDYIEVVFEAVKHDGLALQYAGEKLRADKDVVLEAVKQNPNSIKFASKDIKEAIKRLL